METNGIIKRIDNLGRVVLPKSYRSKLKLRDNDEVEVTLYDNKIILSKHSTIKELELSCELFATVLNNELNLNIIFTDKERVIVSKGMNTGYINGEEISNSFLSFIESNMIYSGNVELKIKVLKNIDIKPILIFPITKQNLVVGSIVVFSNDVEKVEDKHYELVKFVARLISKNLSI